MKNLMFCISLVCLLALGTIPAIGAKRKKLIKSEAQISAVSSDSISVKVGHAVHSYKIDGHTVIHVDDKKANAKDLKKGMHAEVTESQLAPGTASSIEATTGW